MATTGALAAGTVAATATLAQIFPPATVLVLLGDQLIDRLPGGAARAGQFRAESVTVSDLFAGAIVPGFALVAMYILYLVFMAVFFPETCPPIPPEPAAPTRSRAGGRGCSRRAGGARSF